MKKSELLRWGASIAPVVVGLAASTSMLVDYLRPVPVFCDLEGGCGAVRRTVFAAFLGLPTPAWGLAGFLVIAVLSVTGGKLARVGLVATATIAALVAGLLLAVQAKLGQFCPYCVATDSSALVLFGLALHRVFVGWDPPALRAFRVGAGSALGLAVAVPLGLSLFLKPAIPQVIAAELEKTPAGKITVIDFVDFECPSAATRTPSSRRSWRVTGTRSASCASTCPSRASTRTRWRPHAPRAAARPWAKATRSPSASCRRLPTSSRPTVAPSSQRRRASTRRGSRTA